jgi:hypothetical protein
MAFTDFLIERAKENIGELENITMLLKAEKYGDARVAFVSLQAKLRREHPPKVGTVYPTQLSMVWPNYNTYKKQDGRLTTIEFIGFNFDPDSKADLGVEIQDNTGKKLRTAWDNLVVSTPYLAQVDVSVGSGVKFSPGETRLVLLYKGKRLNTVPVTWGERPPMPAERIIKAVLHFQTTNDDKEGGVVDVEFWTAKNFQKQRQPPFFFEIQKSDHLSKLCTCHIKEEGWGEGATRDYDIAFDQPPVLPSEPMIAILRLTDGVEYNISWHCNVEFTLVTDRGNRLVFKRDGIGLDTTGRGRPRSSECEVWKP